MAKLRLLKKNVNLRSLNIYNLKAQRIHRWLLIMQLMLLITSLTIEAIMLLPPLNFM